MVRTKADCGGTGGAYRKVVAARAPRKVLGSGSTNVGSSPPSRKGESKYAGGNPVCVRPTPPWQKGIGEFFGQSSMRSEKENHVIEEEPGCSGIGKRRKSYSKADWSILEKKSDIGPVYALDGQCDEYFVEEHHRAKRRGRYKTPFKQARPLPPCPAEQEATSEDEQV